LRQTVKLFIAFNPGGDDRSGVRTIAHDFNQLIPEGKIVKIVYKNRKENSLAHEIAKCVVRGLCDGVLQGHVLSRVLELALHDCKNAVFLINTQFLFKKRGKSMPYNLGWRALPFFSKFERSIKDIHEVMSSVSYTK
jgi:hypothetical protein